MTPHRRPAEDVVRAELREALAARQPDRTAMLHRIAANRAEPSVRRAEPGALRGRSWRLAGSALAVATVLGLGGVAQWALADDDGPAPAPAAPLPASTPAATSAAPSPTTTTAAAPPPAPTTRPPTSRPQSSAPSSAAPSQPSASPVRGHPGDTQTAKGSLRSTVSIDGATSTVTLIAGADLTELDLTIRVVRTGGRTPAGTAHDAPAADVTASVQQPAGAYLYRFTLRPGATLRAGTYRFTARYAGGSAGRDDTYEAYAFSVERKRIHLYGNFFPKD